MLTDPTHTELLIEEKRSTGLTLVAAVCALLVTGLVFAGYTYLRKRTAEQRLAATATLAPSTPSVPRGPAKAHILVDEALLKGGQTSSWHSQNISGEVAQLTAPWSFDAERTDLWSKLRGRRPSIGTAKKVGT